MCERVFAYIHAKAVTILLTCFLAISSLSIHAATLSGIVKDHQGLPIAGASVSLFQVQNSGFLQIGTTKKVGADGAYTWTVSPGSYVLRSSFNSADVSLTGAPKQAAVSSPDFVISSDTVRDTVYDFLVLSGRVVDTNNAPLANVDIQTNILWQGPETGAQQQLSQRSLSHKDGSVRTDAQGNYIMLLFASDRCIASGFYADSSSCLYDISFTPPTNSGFSNAVRADFAMNRSQNLGQTLTLVDRVNPQIIAGPYVKNVTDQSVEIAWQTDEPTSSTLQVIGGAAFSPNQWRTHHTYVLKELNPATEYRVQLTAADKQNNRSTPANITFTTAASHSDAVAPAFVQPPRLISLSETHLTLAFCASEPVTGKFVVEGVDYPLNEAARCHEVLVQDLEPNQEYSVAAEISDIAGNGPARSKPSIVRTLSAADLTPPLIVSGPVISDVTDATAVVRWTTDEPASSSVSFNDGTNYRVQSDPALVTEHLVQITGLTANTNYQLTAVSTDGLGNFSKPSQLARFVTNAAPDTKAPLLIGRVLVSDIASSSAVISWQTDESASTIVYHGKTADALSSIETAPGFHSQHQLLLTELAAETTYFYKTESRDLAGNLTNSTVQSFKTLAASAAADLEIISQPVVERLTGNSITLSWKTNLNADRRLVCESVNGISEVNRTDLRKNHLLTLIGLDFNTAYRCVVYSSDVDGKIASSVIGALTTNETDSTPPACISAPTAQGFVNYAEITWQADELATGVVNYRVKGSSDWLQSTATSLSEQGFQLVSGLAANTVYEYQVKLTDTLGNSANCAQGEFNSGAAANPPVVPAPVFSLEPVVSNIGQNSARLNWSTERNSNGQVRFGLAENTLDRTESAPEFKLSQELVLSNLKAGTKYFLQVDTFNSKAVKTTSRTISFTTQSVPQTEIKAPRVISGPFVKNISDRSALIEWETDKAGSSRVVIAGGATFSNTTLTTLHSVLLTGLTASTDYASTVSSTDSKGLKSASLPANFRTLALPDATLPRFVAGPNLVAVDYDNFTLSFCADEPVTANVHVDTVGAEASENLTLNKAASCHQFHISERTPRTAYLIQISITDLAGNGPVTSAPLTVTTRFDLDITAPVISGPFVTDITQSTAIVRWTTNEAANSSVVYSAGSSTNHLRDDALVKQHVMYLSGLSARTKYRLTASSTDAAGNGPSISAPVEFTTLALPDTQAPWLLTGPFVENITRSSADIVWSTNETASRKVLLGLTETSLKQEISFTGLSTDHRVPVSDLAADTRYYFRVESADLAGNKISSDVHSFKTLKPEVVIPDLKITAGPDLEEATLSSLTVSWETNLESDSRLVCEAEQATLDSLSSSATDQLAPFYTVASGQVIKDQYIVLLKEPKQNVSILPTARQRYTQAASQVEYFGLSAKQSPVQRKASVKALALDIADKVKGAVSRHYTGVTPGFVMNMPAERVHALRLDPRVLLIEQDQVMRISARQTGATWGLDRIDQANLPLDGSYEYALDGSGVNAYIIDTGILISHADFGGRAAHAWDFIDNDANASDCNGHGTHVAGTVGGSTWGVAKNVKLHGLRVLDCNGSGTSSGVLAGVDWVTANAKLPAVANMSLGGGNSAALDAAVNRAIDAGITVVVAAGNSNINACSGSPNKVPAAITVASSTNSDSRSSFSNWGSCIDMFAPGSNITSTWHTGGSHTISGTSMAAPHVAGAVALYLQANPNARPATVDQRLKGYATQNKISGLNGSPNLLLNTEFDGETPQPAPPPPPPPEKITFEVSDPAKVTFHRLTLNGLTANTVYSCRVFSTDSRAQQVSAPLRGTTAAIPDTTAPECSGEIAVTPYVDSAKVSWAANELSTAVINYRPVNSVDWLQNGSLKPAKADSLLLTGLLGETEYEQQITLSDLAGNKTQCPVGKFTTIAAEDIPEPVFTLQPVVSNISEQSATITWQTQEPASGLVRYGKSAGNLTEQRSANELLSVQSLTLHNLNANTVYYLQVDAFNILGEKTTSDTLVFTTLHIDRDFDNDGVLNEVDNCPLIANPDQKDSDNDGAGDACDPPASVDNDFDKDGILNDVDNCPVTANPDQRDSNNNGIGDACDIPTVIVPDFDGDGIPDAADNCPLVHNADQADSNNNGIGDACDVPPVSDNDYDDDGVLDNVDNCPTIPNPDQRDSNNNGVGDACDVPRVIENDYDRDGILDDRDNCPLIANPTQADRDSNGIGDACDLPPEVQPPVEQPLGMKLSGVINGEGSPVASAQVAVYSRQKQFLRAVTTTADGSYLFENMRAGDYFIGVTPPISSGLSSPPLQAIKLADRDVVHLITLIADAHTLSGVLKDSKGRVIDKVLVSLHQQGTGNQVGNSVRTNAQGYFEFAVAPGTYKLRPLIDVFNPAELQNNEPLVPNYRVPDYAVLLHGPQNIQVTADTALDVNLPFALLSGRALDAQNQPVAGVGLQIRHKFSSLTQDYYLENYATHKSSYALTDQNGNFEFALFTGQTVDILLVPPSSRADLAVTTIEDFSLSGDTRKDFKLVAGVTLSGRLLDAQARAIDFTKVTLHRQDSGVQVGQAVYTDANGTYRFQVEPGTYKIKPHLNPFGQGEGKRPTYPLPDFASVLFAETEIVVSGATSQDVVLPMAVLNGKTTDVNGSPIANTRVIISHIAELAQGATNKGYYLESQGTSLVTRALSNANGEFSLALFTDQAMDLNFIPPLGNQVVGSTLVRDYTLSADKSETFVLSRPLILSGVLQDKQQRPLDNTLISVHHQSNRQLAAAPVLTDANGYFQFNVSEGHYQLRPYLQSSTQVSGQTLTSRYPMPDFAAVYYAPRNIHVFGNTTVDVTLPMSVLSGKALDANGVLVPGVKLRVDHAYTENSLSYYLENLGDAANSNAITGSDGQFAFGLFTGQKTDISMTPPAASGFAVTNVSHTITQETSEDIWLIHKNFAAPKIISGPHVKHIRSTTAVVEWLTDKPASSEVDLANGRRYSNSKLSTQHSVVLTGLSPQTRYQPSVHSVDKDGEASATRRASFTTLSVPDYRAPIILEGPLASNISQTHFTVRLCADEAVTGQILVDGAPFELNELALCHDLIIDGLRANRAYTVVAQVFDEKGNGPTISPELVVTTLAKADVTPPVIQLLPMVIDISSTTATVIWTTDEAATSGVSYNDGTEYHVVSDAEYVQQHVMPLADLKPDTTYSLTVSSTDRQGNGPSISAPISFKTLASADTRAPVIIGSPLIQNITHQSVVIRWATSEPATTRLVIGTSADKLDQIEARNGLSTSHNLPVTGLQADTVYYFQVQTADAQGNLALGKVLSFRTKVRGHQGNPHFMSGVDILEQTRNRLTVYWETDVNADARLVCKSASATLEVSQAKRSKQHTLTLSGLLANTSYTCTAYSTDHHGYTESMPLDSTVVFSASALPVTASNANAPAPSEAAVVKGYGEVALLKLASNKLAVALVEYRLAGSSSWQAAGSQAPSMRHEIMLAELTPGSAYQLRYRLSDIDGNLSQIQSLEFNSGRLSDLAAPRLTKQPTVNEISPSSAVIAWTTAEGSYSQVSFGLKREELFDKEAHAAAALNQSVKLVNLRPASVYYAQVTSFNLLGESVASNIVRFVTSASSSAADSDGDGMTDSWEIEHSLNPQSATDASLDSDNDGLSNLEEYLAQTDPAKADSDSDGMPDGWEVDRGLNPTNAADASADADNNGVSNLNEYLRATDKVAPVISLTSRVTLNARGPLTAVSASNISATDDVDGTVNVVNQGPKHLPPGRHSITWLAEDRAGNRTLATQTVDIKPQVMVRKEQVTGEGNLVKVRVSLSGKAPLYPVRVPFSISGSASTADYTLSGNSNISEDSTQSAGTLLIESGLQAELILLIADDQLAENDEQLTISFTNPVNAVMGPNSQHRITVTEVNIAPQLTLKVEQNSVPVTTVSASGGTVKVSVLVADANQEDAHTFDWSASDNILADTDNDPATLSFNPATLASGIYKVAVSVTDDGAPSQTVTASVNLKVLESYPVLSATQDSDGDGISDLFEGYQDADLDGIPDYLDDLDGAHWLQQAPGAQSMAQGYLLQVEPGAALALGALAFSDARGGARVSSSHFASSALYREFGEDTAYQRSGGLFDFEIRNVTPEDSVLLVIPLQQAMPAEASYRKLDPNNGWRDFVVDSRNQLFSARGEAGVCPAPGDAAYQSGLAQGHYCLMMRIQDGGSNDADGEANGTIVDPGGVARKIASGVIPPTEPTQPPANGSGSSGGGGGGGSAFWLLWLTLLLWLQRTRVATKKGCNENGLQRLLKLTGSRALKTKL